MIIPKYQYTKNNSNLCSQVHVQKKISRTLPILNHAYSPTKKDKIKLLRPKNQKLRNYFNKAKTSLKRNNWNFNLVLRKTRHSFHFRQHQQNFTFRVGWGIGQELRRWPRWTIWSLKRLKKDNKYTRTFY